MLDILANNNWERPIYFSGGSFDPGEYLWMKEYLQLDGLAYKLIPIKTENRNAYDLGRIDTDLMYDIVMNWEWGNSEDPDVYLDTQTRIQGLTFRGNLARLVESLIQENKYDKAKTIINLSLEKMPVEKFGFYTFVEPFLSGYFQVGEPQKGEELFNRLKTIYQERLNYYSHTDYDYQYAYIDQLVSDLEAYRRIVDIYLVSIEDEEKTLIERDLFNSYVDRFEHFMGDEKQEVPLGAPDTLDLGN
jgi:hypothetical protein